MSPRRLRFAIAIALAGVLVMPNLAIAGERATDAPPAPVITWQEHLEHMRAMAPNLGSHIRDRIAEHGSMARMMGPNGMMGEETRP